MSHDRRLIESIKQNFERKSSAQLQEITRTNDSARWSPEAIAAAAEVLRDRQEGRSVEPLEGEPDAPPAPLRSDSYSLAYLALGALGGLTGMTLLPVVSRFDHDADEPDLPVPFGQDMAWFAIDSTDTTAVACALGLQDPRPVSWSAGVEAAKQAAVFVTPPLGDWTLALGSVLFPPDRADDFVRPLLVTLSRQFKEAQYFCAHNIGGLTVWARARRGNLVRGYGWLADKSLTLWDEGDPTEDEQALGLVFSNGWSADNTRPDVNTVMQIANFWSIDPTSLDEQFKEPETGLLGGFARVDSPADL
jgi:hypothetical protein